MKKKSLLLFAILCISATLQATAMASYVLTNENATLEKKDKLYFELKPGQSYTEYLTLTTNDSDKGFIVYPVDVSPIPTDQGKTAYKNKGETNYTVGAWLKTSTEEIDLKKGERKTIKVTATIPKDTPLGLYEGGLAIQNKNKSQHGAIVFSFRKIEKVEILITENPTTLKRQFDVFPWQKFYLTISMIIFAIFITTIAIKKVSKKQ